LRRYVGGLFGFFKKKKDIPASASFKSTNKGSNSNQETEQKKGTKTAMTPSKPTAKSKLVDAIDSKSDVVSTTANDNSKTDETQAKPIPNDINSNQRDQREHNYDSIDDESSEAQIDYTEIPKALEKQFEQLDKEGAVRPTIINPGLLWTKRAQKALLADPTSTSLGVDDQKSEKNRAFDLLDALSRSGGLSVDHASLHVVIAATHCFDSSVIDTIVKNNVNPIEKVERSTLIMASTIHGRVVSDLVKDDHQNRLLDLKAD
jgi:hypothetical protein